MIRPFTAICCAFAAGAVLYTYQSKHDVQLLDRQIEKTLGDTATLREQSRALKAEWTLRENPERLKTFADQYLALKPVAPTQFTTLAELDTRLPAPRIGTQDPDPANTTEEPDAAPMASGTGQPEAPEENVADADDLLFLKDAEELDLDAGGDLADLVEKDRAALGRNQQSVLGAVGPGEGAFDVAEEFTLDQRRHQ